MGQAPDQPLIGLSLLTVRPGRIGGAETYVNGLLGGIIDAGKADVLTVLGNSAVMAAYSPRYGQTIRLRHVPAIRVTRSPVGRAISLAAAFASKSKSFDVATQDLDLIHYPVAVAIPRICSRSAVTLHDVQHHAMPQYFSKVQRLYRAVAYDRSARCADVVITVSEYSRSEIIRVLDIDPRKVISIHHGIDHRRFHVDGAHDAERLAAFNLPERFVYYPANSWPHKNHVTLIRAIADLQDRSLHVVLTGETYGKSSEIRTLARRSGVSERVHHLGYVDATVIPALYRRALVVAFPSLYEGFGAPPLEAMACGTPVVISRAPALEEVCGDAALVVGAEDPSSLAARIDEAAEPGASREHLITRAVAHAARFSWSKSAAQHLATYRDTVERVAR